MGTLRRAATVAEPEGLHAELDAELVRVTPDDVVICQWRPQDNEPSYVRVLYLKSEPRVCAPISISGTLTHPDAMAVVAKRAAKAVDLLRNPPPAPSWATPLPAGYAA